VRTIKHQASSIKHQASSITHHSDRDRDRDRDSDRDREYARRCALCSKVYGADDVCCDVCFVLVNISMLLLVCCMLPVLCFCFCFCFCLCFCFCFCFCLNADLALYDGYDLLSYVLYCLMLLLLPYA
jgi:hypothetical protein